MTRTHLTRGLTLTLWLAASTMLVAAQGGGSFTYDPAAEVSLSGTIMHVVSFAAPDGSVGVHFDLKTDKGLLNVHVGPAIYIGQENFWFFADEKIDVVGVKATIDGNKSLVLRTLTKGDKTLTLRDPSGTPLWKPPVNGTDGCGVAHPGLPRGTEL
jgi:hypothetical protein